MPFTDRPLPDDFEVPPIAPRKPGKRLFGPDNPGVKPKGAIAKITKDLKEGILQGAIAHGANGGGENGLQGYLQMCATKYPKHYMHLLGKLLPHVIKGDGASSVAVSQITIVTVPRGEHLSSESIANKEPSQIEHEPQSEPIGKTEQIEVEIEAPPAEPKPEPEDQFQRAARLARERGDQVMRDPGFRPRMPGGPS